MQSAPSCARQTDSRADDRRGLSRVGSSLANGAKPLTARVALPDDSSVESDWAEEVDTRGRAEQR